MSEVRSEVRTYITNYVCDDCGTGEMNPNGVVTELTLYEHICANCGAKATFPVQYPYLTREKIT